MSKTVSAIILWIASLAIVEALIHWKESQEPAHVVSDTIVVYKEDSHPQPVDSIQTKVIIRRLPIYRTVHDTETITRMDTIRDSVSVEVPISKKIYYGTDYYAEISGYQQSLDSIRVRQAEIVNTTIQESSRWGLGVSAGYSLTPKGLQPYIGIGIQYNIFKLDGRKRTIKSGCQ